MQTPSLEKIVAETLAGIDNSKAQIYEIAQNALSESERVKKEHAEIQQQVLETIDKVDALERLEKSSRVRLMEVSKNFERYGEQEVRRAYEKAREFQVELASLREREHQLKLRRNDLEQSLRKLMGTAQKAEELVSQVGVVLDYLGGNLTWINNELEVVNQKRLLAPKIIQAQEEERKRVAREIHDGPAQSMANVVLRSEVCEKYMDLDVQKAREELQELRVVVKNSLQDVRRIIFDLRPMALDDLGLLPALSRYFESLKERYQLDIEFNHSGLRGRISSSLEISLYRLVQEAVQNCLKHAQAKKVMVKTETDAERITLTIKDDGVGFDSETFLKEPHSNSFGLLGMRERVEILGGQLFITSALKKGTEITAILPIDLGGGENRTEKN